MKNLKKSVYSTILAIIILIIVGYTYDRYHSQTPVEYVVSIIENLDHSPKGTFRNSWRIIKNNYVDDTFNHQDWNKWKNRYESRIKTRGDARVAINSMLISLNDPYTRFLPKYEFEEQHRNIDSKLQGIGVHLTEFNGNIIIISVIDDTPAQKYGLKKRDKIVKINSVSTKGMSLKDVAVSIRGKEGTEVVLTISREGKLLTKKIIREEIKIKTVKYKMLANNIAYVRIASFISQNTTDEFRKALYATQKAAGIIIDLRGNYGGLFSNAIYISNMFIKSGNIVSMVDRSGKKQDFNADAGRFITSKPAIILIDGSSASASEIFSGAMQDHKKALLVGEKSFGKGLVQMITKLPDGSGINFTIAKYLTPSGRDINHKGIEPDYKVDGEGSGFTEKDDNQFNKAVKLLLDEISPKAIIN